MVLVEKMSMNVTRSDCIQLIWIGLFLYIFSLLRNVDSRALLACSHDVDFHEILKFYPRL